MDKLIIEGGAKLSGSVNISGSKNSSLPILAACLLTREECIIRRVPDVSDTNYMLQILRSLGAEVERASGTVKISAKKISNQAPYDLVRKMRASICVMGPLLARKGEVLVSMPGGCVIGDRPIDLHLRGLKALGAKIDIKGGDIKITGKNLHGCEVNMGGKLGSTVLGTDNLIMLATLTNGTTIIENAAQEPEVEDLAKFLVKLGANIESIGTSTLKITGVKKLGGAEHIIIPDRIETGTYLIAGAMCASHSGIKLNRTKAEHLQPVIEKLKNCGHELQIDKNSIFIKRNDKATGASITTETYPGFPTDMQAQFSALFSISDGLSVITEKIFPQRFMHIAELNRMGAHAHIEGVTAIIRGVEHLSAAPVMASDLRASAALVLAGLVAKGKTQINRVYHIDRGYEHIDDKLINLGAKIKRVKDD